MQTGTGPNGSGYTFLVLPVFCTPYLEALHTGTGTCTQMLN